MFQSCENTLWLLAVSLIALSIGAGLRPAKAANVAVETITVKKLATGCSIDVSYPRLKLNSRQASEANRAIERAVMQQIEANNALLKDYKLLKESSEQLSFSCRSEVTRADNKFFSVRLIFKGETGGTGSNCWVETFNYDLTSGKCLTLQNVYGKPPLPLASLAELCRNRLLQSLAASDPDWIDGGADTRAESYSAFNLLGDDIQISFQPSQVAPHSEGPCTIVIPSREWKSLSRSINDEERDKRRNHALVKFYSKKIKRDPKSHPSYVGRAEAYVRLESWAAALADYDQLPEYELDESQMYHRALCALGLKDYRSAIYDLDRAIAFNDSLPQYYTARARANLKLHHLEQAKDDFEHAINAGETATWIHFERALICLKLSDLMSALNDLDYVIEGDRTDTDAHFHRGMCYLQLKDYAGAIRDLQVAARKPSLRERANKSIKEAIDAWSIQTDHERRRPQILLSRPNLRSFQ